MGTRQQPTRQARGAPSAQVPSAPSCRGRRDGGVPTRVTPGEALGQQQDEEAFEGGDLTGAPTAVCVAAAGESGQTCCPQPSLGLGAGSSHGVPSVSFTV